MTRLQRDGRSIRPLFEVLEPRLPLAGVASVVETVLPIVDMVYDSNRDLIYASVPSTVRLTGNSIAAINPNNGDIVRMQPIGSDPGQIAVSHDGRYLYVALGGPGKIQRVDLNDYSLDLVIDAGYTVRDIEVVPGSPTSIAVAEGGGPSAPGTITLYDGAVARANVGDGSEIDFNDTGSELFSFLPSGHTQSLKRFAVSGTGLTTLATGAGVVSSGPADQLQFEDGRLYMNTRQIFDATTLEQVATFGQATNDLVVEASKSRAFAIADIKDDVAVLSLQSFVLIDSIQVPNETGGVDDLNRVGSDGLAYKQGSSVFVIRSSVIGSHAPPDPNPPPPYPNPLPAVPTADGLFSSVDLKVVDLIYDATADRLIASVPASVPVTGNSIAILNADTAAIETTFFIGSDPGELALSADGRYLYVGLGGPGKIQRVDMSTLTLDLLIDSGSTVRDIEVLPGASTTIAVAQGGGPSVPGTITVYDGATARTNTGDGSEIVFDDSGNLLFSFLPSGHTQSLKRFSVNANGLVQLNAGSGVVSSGPASQLDFSGGRLMMNTGQVFDATNLVQVARFPASTNDLAIDGGYGDAYIAVDLKDNIRVHSLERFVQTRAIRAPGFTGGVDELIRVGTDGLAFKQSDKVVIARSSLVPPFDWNPTLNPPATQLQLPEDAPTYSLLLSGITAGPGEQQPIKVTATSGNVGILPPPVVGYSSPDYFGSLDLTPPPNVNGSALVTVTVTDGGLDRNLQTPADNKSFSRSFTVTITPENDPPTFDPIDDPSPIDENASQQVINVTGVSPGPFEFQPLSIVAISNRPQLIPHPSVQHISGTPAATIRYTPQAGESGTANITVIATDGGADNNLATTADNASFQRSFAVRVNPHNDPPTIDAIDDQSIDEDRATVLALPLTGISPGIGDNQPVALVASSNNTNLVDHPAIDYVAGQTTATLTIPAPQADAFGPVAIDVVITDGGDDNNLDTPNDNQSFMRSFTLTIRPINDAPLVSSGNPSRITDEDTVLDLPVGGLLNAGSGSTLISDADADPDGIAIFSAVGRGQLLYSLDGIQFDPFSTPVDLEGLLLPATAQLRYQPDGRNGESVQVHYFAWDGSTGTAGSFVDALNRGGTHSLSLLSDTLTITVTPVNDAPTAVRLTPTNVVENLAGATIGALEAIDADVGDTHAFSVADPRFAVEGNTLTLSATTHLNFEQTGSIELDVTATDSGQQPVTSSITIVVVDANDQPTVEQSITNHSVWSDFPYRLDIPPGSFGDEDAGQTLSLAVRLGDGSDLPSWLSFDQGSNRLSGLPLAADAGTLNLNVTATDTGLPPMAVDMVFDVEITVNPRPWQNPLARLDVNNRGGVTPIDALLGVNYLNANAGNPALPPVQFDPPRFLDTSGDNAITPVDILLVINHLNSPEGEGEPCDCVFGESAKADSPEVVSNSTLFDAVERWPNLSPPLLQRDVDYKLWGSSDASSARDRWHAPAVDEVQSLAEALAEDGAASAPARDAG